MQPDIEYAKPLPAINEIQPIKPYEIPGVQHLIDYFTNYDKQSDRRPDVNSNPMTYQLQNNAVDPADPAASFWEMRTAAANGFDNIW